MTAYSAEETASSPADDPATAAMTKASNAPSKEFQEQQWTTKGWISAANMIGINQDDVRMRRLVDDMLSTDSLPHGWKANFDDAKEQWSYTSTDEKGVVSALHPLIDFYKGAAFMDTGGYWRLKKNLEAKAPEPWQVLAECKRLGIKEDEDLHVQEVGELSLASPLPKGWRHVHGPRKDSQVGVSHDKNQGTGPAAFFSHPCKPQEMRINSETLITKEIEKNTGLGIFNKSGDGDIEVARELHIEGSDVTDMWINKTLGITLTHSPMEPYFIELRNRRRKAVARRHWAAVKAMAALMSTGRQSSVARKQTHSNHDDPQVAHQDADKNVSAATTAISQLHCDQPQSFVAVYEEVAAVENSAVSCHSSQGSLQQSGGAVKNDSRLDGLLALWQDVQRTTLLLSNHILSFATNRVTANKAPYSSLHAKTGDRGLGSFHGDESLAPVSLGQAAVSADAEESFLLTSSTTAAAPSSSSIAASSSISDVPVTSNSQDHTRQWSSSSQEHTRQWSSSSQEHTRQWSSSSHLASGMRADITIPAIVTGHDDAQPELACRPHTQYPYATSSQQQAVYIKAAILQTSMVSCSGLQPSSEISLSFLSLDALLKDVENLLPIKSSDDQLTHQLTRPLPPLNMDCLSKAQQSPRVYRDHHTLSLMLQQLTDEASSHRSNDSSRDSSTSNIQQHAAVDAKRGYLEDNAASGDDGLSCFQNSVSIPSHKRTTETVNLAEALASLQQLTLLYNGDVSNAGYNKTGFEPALPDISPSTMDEDDKHFEFARDLLQAQLTVLQVSHTVLQRLLSACQGTAPIVYGRDQSIGTDLVSADRKTSVQQSPPAITEVAEGAACCDNHGAQLDQRKGLPVDWRDQVQELRGLPVDWRDQVQELRGLPVDWRDQVQELKGLPADWRDQVQELRGLPVDWRDQVQELRGLPVDWRDRVQELRGLPVDWRDQIPSDWSVQLQFHQWPLILRWLPADWPVLLQQLSQDFLNDLPALAPDWYQHFSSWMRNSSSCMKHHMACQTEEQWKIACYQHGGPQITALQPSDGGTKQGTHLTRPLRSTTTYHSSLVRQPTPPIGVQGSQNIITSSTAATPRLVMPPSASKHSSTSTTRSSSSKAAGLSLAMSPATTYTLPPACTSHRPHSHMASTVSMCNSGSGPNDYVQHAHTGQTYSPANDNVQHAHTGQTYSPANDNVQQKQAGQTYSHYGTSIPPACSMPCKRLFHRRGISIVCPYHQNQVRPNRHNVLVHQHAGSMKARSLTTPSPAGSVSTPHAGEFDSSSVPPEWQLRAHNGNKARARAMRSASVAPPSASASPGGGGLSYCLEQATRPARSAAPSAEAATYRLRRFTHQDERYASDYSINEFLHLKQLLVRTEKDSAQLSIEIQEARRFYEDVQIMNAVLMADNSTSRSKLTMERGIRACIQPDHQHQRKFRDPSAGIVRSTRDNEETAACGRNDKISSLEALRSRLENVTTR
ncbi:hypothetical protein CEUSTIGMA_g12458.t1 [Chlamydomonas eustigma]|uniref:Uncharacterized protein n=1 Tax=Chlamydomonas eustigma TaxID=1157962 RepID=A0A250XPQ2_9CHLO|nr:hypothetical protein CEUSTIGMA_g12458.t1 [Chlamydomonas eustigma]|eukprot:GAX85038.1 hypothetical protein CEUSTIGMA_g12458.t1 [Chlamydomonas eustigma]